MREYTGPTGNLYEVAFVPGDPPRPAAVGNTAAIAARCNVKIEFGTLHHPQFPIPPEFPDGDAYLAHLARDQDDPARADALYRQAMPVAAEGDEVAPTASTATWLEGLGAIAVADGRPERHMLLSTPEGENRAWRLYRRLGFGDVLRNYRFTGDPRPFGVLGRELPLLPPAF